MRLLLTGADGFTGKHIADAAIVSGYEVLTLKADLTVFELLEKEVRASKPTHVIHLAAISDLNDSHQENYYRVNLFGTLNLLRALEGLEKIPEKVILASSANVYGANSGQLTKETQEPKPVNQYAMSKLAMEYMSILHADRLPILFTRPFNYTGVGHDNRFVVPKIVEHFLNGKNQIELGNLKVEREYNDVRNVSQIYLELLQKGHKGEIYNIASGRTFSIESVIALLRDITGQSMNVSINPAFVRKNDIPILSGYPDKLEACIGHISWHELRDTLLWMLENSKKKA
jgi:nucleoside-diphosphate-sugar epimerase